MQTFNPLSDGYPTVTSPMPAGTTQITPYTFNNLDGLWVGETVSTGGTGDADRIIACGDEESLQWVGGAWESVIADLEKQQKDTYKSDVPFTETDSKYSVRSALFGFAHVFSHLNMSLVNLMNNL